MARQIKTTKDPPRGSYYKRCYGVLDYRDESVSVAMEEVKSQDWVEVVYKPDIENKWDTLYKKPGYDVNDL
jgi:hypothetical protein